MAPTDLVPAASSDPFPSLAVLRQRHADLLRAVPADALQEKHLAEVREFLRRGTAAGAVLDLPAERDAAQALLDYWKATLYTQKRERRPAPSAAGDPGVCARLPSAVLADFDERALRQVAEAGEGATRALEQAHPALADAMRRVLLRLLPMPAEGMAPVPAARPREELLAAGDRAQTQRVLDALQGAGVLTGTPGGAGTDAVALRYDGLARLWPRLAGWVGKRALLRDAALFWDRHKRDRSVLVTGPLLEQAKDYQDFNGLEQEFVRASREETDRRAEAHTREVWVWRLVAGAIGVLLLLAVGLGFLAWEGERKKAQAAEALHEADHRQAMAAQQELVAEREVTMLVLLRGLGDIAAAESKAERALACERWKVLSAQESGDRQVTPFLKKYRSLIDAIAGTQGGPRNGAVQTDAYQRLRGEVLEVAQQLRHDILHSGNEDSVKQLDRFRGLTYDLVGFLADNLVVEARKGTPLKELRPYAIQFWKLYWGEMGMFEGSSVSQAMVAFGKCLREWEDMDKGEPAPKELQERLAAARATLAKNIQDELANPLRPLGPDDKPE